MLLDAALSSLLAPGGIFYSLSGQPCQLTAAISFSRFSTISLLTSLFPASPKSLSFHNHSLLAPSISVKVSATCVWSQDRYRFTFTNYSRFIAYQMLYMLRQCQARLTTLSILSGY